MNNLNDDKFDKEEIKRFVDYAIKKIESNVVTIKMQQDQIRQLEHNLEEINYKNVVNSYSSPYDKNDLVNRELRANAQKEADLIISEAKNNANKIINDALLQAEKTEMQRKILENNIKLSKNKVRRILREQLDLVEEIEIL